MGLNIIGRSCCEKLKQQNRLKDKLTKVLNLRRTDSRIRRGKRGREGESPGEIEVHLRKGQDHETKRRNEGRDEFLETVAQVPVRKEGTEEEGSQDPSLRGDRSGRDRGRDTIKSIKRSDTSFFSEK